MRMQNLNHSLQTGITKNATVVLEHFQQKCVAVLRGIMRKNK